MGVDKKMKAVVGEKASKRIISRAIVKAFHKVHKAARHQAGSHKKLSNSHASKSKKHHEAKVAKKHKKVKKSSKKHAPKKEVSKKKKTTKKHAPKAKGKKVVKKGKKSTKHSKVKKLKLTQLSAATRQKMMAYIASHEKKATANKL